jgi:hypothetical protein
MEHIIYTKFSNDRAERFKIKTSIFENKSGEKQVCKQPITSAAMPHIASMHQMGLKLAKQYQGTKLSVNKSELFEDRIIFEFLNGCTLDEILDEYLSKGKYDKFKDTVASFFEILRSTAKDDFKPSEEYKKVFGNIAPDFPQKSAQINDIDLIFDNLFLSGDNLIITDYEWTFDFQIPIDFIIYRTCFYYELAGHLSAYSDKINLYSIAGITEEQKDLYRRMDDAFQSYVVGDTILLGEIHSKIRGDIYFPLGLVENQKLKEITRNISIVQHVNGKSNDSVYSFSPTVDADGRIRFEIKPEADVQRIHINPASCHCIVHIYKIRAVGEQVCNVDFVSNGTFVTKNQIAFTNSNPSILIALPPKGTKRIEVEMMIEYPSKSFVDEQSKLGNDLEILREKCDELSSAIAQKENELAQKEIEIAQKENELARKKNELTEILNSTSWKLTKPLRAIGGSKKQKEN